jgi:hypothetical protein
MDTSTMTVSIIIFYDAAFEYDDGGICGFWVEYKTFTSQLGAMKYCMLTYLQRMNNFNKTIFPKK